MLVEMDWLLSCLSLICLVFCSRCAVGDELENNLNVFVHSSTGSDHRLSRLRTLRTVLGYVV